MRPSQSKKNKGKPISPKTVSNKYGLITALIKQYYPALDCTVKLPVLLAMWLSFSASEIQGLTKSESIHNGYITINEAGVTVNNELIKKKQAKTKTRTRKHKIPDYIQELIDKTDPNTDKLVTAAHGYSPIDSFLRLILFSVYDFDQKGNCMYFPR